MSKLTVHVTDETGREVTLSEQLEASREAWTAVREAIEEAWKITPEFLIHERGTISRKAKDQTIAYDAAVRMAGYAEQALASIARNQHSIDNGYEFALTEQEAAEGWKR